MIVPVALAAIGAGVVTFVVVFFIALFIIERSVQTDEGLGIVWASFIVAATLSSLAFVVTLTGGLELAWKGTH